MVTPSVLALVLCIASTANMWSGLSRGDNMPKQLTAKEMAKKSVASRRAKYKTEEEYRQAMKDMAAKRKVKGNFKKKK